MITNEELNKFLKSTRMWVIQRCILETFSTIIYCKRREDMIQGALRFNMMPSDLEKWKKIKFKYQGLTYKQAQESHWRDDIDTTELDS
ncbi:hypothetical protein LCGC14_0174300 [marine sediment metagenome]|uniref:Uncharacterized protein n=1 Tax=marine sediment metagenome TaxID=412755 RepID=A0A0F9V769_9ZZZZ